MKWCMFVGKKTNCSIEVLVCLVPKQKQQRAQKIPKDTMLKAQKYKEFYQNGHLNTAQCFALILLRSSCGNCSPKK
jgi:hypothetical protein